MKKIILVGAGGHCLGCIDVIQGLKKFKIVGLIDKNKIGKILNYKILGDDNSLELFRKKYNYAFVTIGQIKNYELRYNIFKKLKKLKYKIPKLISKFSYLSEYLNIDEGTIIMNNVNISPNVKIGFNSIINTGSILEHGVIIGNNCHIATNVTINGDVKIEDNTFIGSGSIIKNGIHIGRNSFVKMGSIIIKNINESKN